MTSIGSGSGYSIDQSVMTNFDDLITNVSREKEVTKKLRITDSLSQADQTQTVDRQIVMDSPKPEAPVDLSQLGTNPKDSGQNLYAAIQNDQLTKLAAGPPPMSIEQQKELRFALNYGPGAPVDKNIADLANQVMEKIKEQIISSGEDIPLPTPADFQKYKDNLNNLASSMFETNVQNAVKEGKISPDQAKQLILGHNMPELANPALKKLMEKFEDATMTQLNQSQGVPLNTQLNADGSAFTKELSGDYSSLVDDNLDKLAKQSGLTDKQLAQLKFMHAHPEVNFPGKGALQSVLSQAEAAASKKMQGEFGLPANFKLTPDTHLYDNIAQGFFKNELSTQVENFLKSDPNVTDDNIIDTRNLINFALKNPGNPDIPPEIQAVAKELIAAAWAKVGANLGIPPGTISPPSTGPLTGGSLDPSQSQLLTNGMQVVDSKMTIATNLVLTMPEGPAKGQLMTFLKTLSDALASLKEFQYTLESTDAENSKKSSLSRLDQKLQQMEYEKIMMDKMKEKLEKLGIASTCFESIMAVAAVLVAIVFLAALAAQLMAFAVELAAVLAISTAVTISTEAVAAKLKEALKNLQGTQSENDQNIGTLRNLAQRENAAKLLMMRQILMMIHKIEAAIAGAVQGANAVMKGEGAASPEAQQNLAETLQAMMQTILAMIDSVKNFMSEAAKVNASKSPEETDAARLEMSKILQSIFTQSRDYSTELGTMLEGEEDAEGIQKAATTIDYDGANASTDVNQLNDEIAVLLDNMQGPLNSLLGGLSDVAYDTVDATAMLGDISKNQDETSAKRIKE